MQMIKKVSRGCMYFVCIVCLQEGRVVSTEESLAGPSASSTALFRHLAAFCHGPHTSTTPTSTHLQLYVTHVTHKYIG